jgi:hypothetical protein
MELEALHHVYKSPQVRPILSQFNPAHTFTQLFCTNTFNTALARKGGSPKWPAIPRIFNRNFVCDI